MFSIAVAHPFGVTVQPQAVITAARAGPSTSSRLPADSLRRSSHRALQMPSLIKELGEGEQKRCRYLPALHLPLAKVSLAEDRDGWQRMVTHHQPTHGVCLFFPPSLQLKPPPPSQPHPIKRLCVVPPAPIEVSTTNYPFIPAVVPSAQHRSPCHPLHSPSSMLKKIFFFFPPMKNSPPALTFIPSPFFALPWYIACSYRKTLTMKEISGGGEDNTGASIHPDSCSCSHKQPIKILFSPSPFTC